MDRRRYLLEQEHILKLYWEGNECINITGGWVDAFGRGGFTKYADHIDVTYYSTGNAYGIKMLNNIDMSNYNSIFIEAYTSLNKPSNAVATPRNIDGSYMQVSVNIPYNRSTYDIVEIDIKNIKTTAKNLYIYGQYYSISTGTAHIKRIWLE